MVTWLKGVSFVQLSGRDVVHCETMEVGMRGEAISVVDKGILLRSSSVTRI